MTNYEKMAEDKEEMVYYMMCPYGVDVLDCLPECKGKTCMECCMEWLDKEAEG